MTNKKQEIKAFNANIARPAGLLNFYGMTLVIADYNDEHYIAFRPIIDLLGLTWRQARDSVSSTENRALYGTIRLKMVKTDTYLGEPEAISTPYGVDNQHTKNKFIESDHFDDEALYIQLNRAHLYLARVNTARMRANGKETAADQLIELQKEWGDVLHRYESGQTVSKSSDERTLINLINAQEKTKDPLQKQGLSKLINQKLQVLGVVYNDPQGQLPV